MYGSPSREAAGKANILRRTIRSRSVRMDRDGSDLSFREANGRATILRGTCGAEADRTIRDFQVIYPRDVEADRWVCDAEADRTP